VDRPTPEDYQPRLGAWGHGWRVLLMLGLSAVVWFPDVVVELWERHRVMFWVDVALGVLSYALVLRRRRWPMTVAVILSAMATLSGLAAGPATLAAASVATRRRMWQVVTIGVVNLVSAQAFSVLPWVRSADPYWVVLSVNITVIVAVLALGMYVGSRRELVWTLKQRAHRAETEQALRVDQARGNERARIAREMHDVLAHRISQVSMHAGALAFRDDLDADALRAGVGDIQAKANQALTELRAVLGVLRDDETGELLSTPQPTYDDLSRLVADARSSGVAVELTDTLERSADVPEIAGRTIYRVVQEGITNARKHAPGSAVAVTVAGRPEDGIDVAVRNPVGFGRTSTPGAGLGLVGLSERAELRGGRLEHGTLDGVFELHAWIPWAT
jgi:signal transduction histidine kinase